MPKAFAYFPDYNVGSAPMPEQSIMKQTTLKNIKSTETIKTSTGRKPKAWAFEEGMRKVERFLISNDTAVGVLFNVLDTDSNSFIEKGEFKMKLRGLRVGLLEEELQAMWEEFDSTNTGRISPKEFAQQFRDVQAAQIIRRMRTNVYGSGASPAVLFDQHCGGAGSKKMNIKQFSSLVAALCSAKALADSDLEAVFDALDKGRQGYLSRDQVLPWFRESDKHSGLSPNKSAASLEASQMDQSFKQTHQKTIASRLSTHKDSRNNSISHK